MRTCSISLAVAAAAGLVSACHGKAEAPQVLQAWVRLPAAGGRPGAAYFTLVGGGAADRLVRVESALATKAELHGSMGGAHGMMRMTPLKDVGVPAHGQVAFKPGGHHVMLYGIDRAVKPGTAIPLRFGFASGRTAEAEAKTVNAGDPAPY